MGAPLRGRRAAGEGGWPLAPEAPAGLLTSAGLPSVWFLLLPAFVCVELCAALCCCSVLCAPHGPDSLPRGPPAARDAGEMSQ